MKRNQVLTEINPELFNISITLKTVNLIQLLQIDPNPASKVRFYRRTPCSWILGIVIMCHVMVLHQMIPFKEVGMQSFLLHNIELW